MLLNQESTDSCLPGDLTEQLGTVVGGEPKVFLKIKILKCKRGAKQSCSGVQRTVWGKIWECHSAWPWRYLTATAVICALHWAVVMC